MVNRRRTAPKVAGSLQKCEYTISLKEIRNRLLVGPTIRVFFLPPPPGMRVTVLMPDDTAPVSNPGYMLVDIIHKRDKS